MAVRPPRPLDGRSIVTMSPGTEIWRVDPHDKAVRKKWGTRVGLSVLGLLTLAVFGFLGWRTRRTRPISPL